MNRFAKAGIRKKPKPCKQPGCRKLTVMNYCVEHNPLFTVRAIRNTHADTPARNRPETRADTLEDFGYGAE